MAQFRALQFGLQDISAREEGIAEDAWAAGLKHSADTIKDLEEQLTDAIERADDNETRAESEEQHALDNWNSFVDMRERAERAERLLDFERHSFI